MSSFYIKSRENSSWCVIHNAHYTDFFRDTSNFPQASLLDDAYLLIYEWNNGEVEIIKSVKDNYDARLALDNETRTIDATSKEWFWIKLSAKCIGTI
jgi:hypothetical protein